MNPHGHLLSREESSTVHRLSWTGQIGPLLYVPAWTAFATISVFAAEGSLPLAAAIPLALLGWAGSGLCLAAFFLLMHEGTHGTLARSRPLNRWLGRLTGLPIFLGFTGYKVLHLRHHDHLGGPEDPDEYENLSRRPAILLLLQVFRLTIGSYLYLVLIPLLGWKHGSAEDRRGILLETLLHAVVYTLAFLWIPSRVLVLGWILPTLAANLLTNARGLAQHGLAVPTDPYLASRSIRPPRWVRAAYLNENYHLEHHLFPGVPHYRLHELHLLLRPRLPRALWIPGYFWFLRRFTTALRTGDLTPIGFVEHEGRPAPR